MTELFQTLLPYKVFASHIVLVVLAGVLAYAQWGKGGVGGKKGVGERVIQLVGKHAEVLGLLVSLAAVIGSLFYSNVIGFEPCVLCWWQRVFLYPLPILFAVALWKKDKNVWRYAVPLATIAGIISLYHSYVYMGGTSILPCTALGGACSKIYVMTFGYITIPAMALTVSLYVLLIAWAKRLYDKNRNA